MGKSICSSKKELRRLYRRRTYYFILFIILGVCILQFLLGSLYNCTRYLVLNSQLEKLEKLNRNALEKNRELKAQLKIYATCKGIEELARNNLKMVGRDEVLVLIKDQVAID